MTRLYVTYFRTAEQSTLSGPQLSILHRLEDDGPSRIRQLAEAEGVRMPTASNTINQLEPVSYTHLTLPTNREV